MAALALERGLLTPPPSPERVETQWRSCAPQIEAPAASRTDNLRDERYACLFIGNLNAGKDDAVLKAQLFAEFKKFGFIVSLTVFREQYHRPCAFVQYKFVVDAMEALYKMAQAVLMNRVLRVEESRLNKNLFIFGIQPRAGETANWTADELSALLARSFGPLSFASVSAAALPTASALVGFRSRQDACKAYNCLRKPNLAASREVREAAGGAWPHGCKVEWAADEQPDAGPEAATAANVVELYVNGVDMETCTPAEWRALFGRYGEVLYARFESVDPQRKSYVRKGGNGYGYVGYSSVDAARAAVAALDHSLHGASNRMRVRFRNQKFHSPGADDASAAATTTTTAAAAQRPASLPAAIQTTGLSPRGAGEPITPSGTGHDPTRQPRSAQAGAAVSRRLPRPLSFPTLSASPISGLAEPFVMPAPTESAALAAVPRFPSRACPVTAASASAQNSLARILAESPSAQADEEAEVRDACLPAVAQSAEPASGTAALNAHPERFEDVEELVLGMGRIATATKPRLRLDTTRPATREFEPTQSASPANSMATAPLPMATASLEMPHTPTSPRAFTFAPFSSPMRVRRPHAGIVPGSPSAPPPGLWSPR